jgi:riboflavin biosynthesis pyrimidine reductase
LTLKPLERLYDAPDLPSFELPDELRTLYAGPFGLDEPLVYANFVQTIDGTVAIASLDQSNLLISGGNEADRFVMGLLRACADVVVIGAGTLRASARATWQPDRVFPAAAESFAELRRRLGRPASVDVAVVTASGEIDPSHPVLERGAIVLTSERGAEALADRVPEAATVVFLGGELTVDPAQALEALRDRGHRRILSEAGPTLFGSLVSAGLIDELFLTVSPLLAASPHPGARLSLAGGVNLPETEQLESRLESIRRDNDYLFLRYRLADEPRDAASRP